MEQESVAVRTRAGEDLGSIGLEEFAQRVADEASRRVL
jgi:threonyl-tRNA synthetase